VRLRPVLFVAGAAVVAWLIVRVGPGEVWQAFRTLSWRLAVIAVFPTGVVVALDTLGWRLAFPTPPRRLGRLLGARLAGDAVNLSTPTASVGGEPVKVHLLMREVPARDALVSVIADKTTGVVAQSLMLAAGLVVGAGLLPARGSLFLAMAGLLAVEVLCVGGFIAVQLGGIGGRGGRLLARLGIALGPERQAALEGVDVALRSLYAGRRRRLAASVLCHFLAFAVATLEIYLVATFLGVAVSPATAFVIGAVGTAVRFVSFMVPGSLGALEGGHVAVFTAFGLPGAVGLSYSLVRRLREIFWITLGFGAWAVLHRSAAQEPFVEMRTERP